MKSSHFQKCKLCGSLMSALFRKKVLHKYPISYFKCNNCDFVQTEDPFWLEEAYTRTINDEDTGLVSRNLAMSKIFTILIWLYFDKSGKFLDYAGGYGLFTRLARDIGFDCYWYDQYCHNLLAVGFESKAHIKRYEMITGFEVLEHLPNPISEIKKIFKQSDSFLFSTQLYNSGTDLETWDYLGVEHGQHISLYSQKSLQKITEKLNLNLYSDGMMIHLLTKKKLSNIIFHNLIRFHRYLYPVVSLKFQSKTMVDHNKLK